MSAIRFGALAVATVSAAVVAAGASARPASVRTEALFARVNVTASEFKFVLSKKSAKRGIVVFRVTNVGAIKHDFSISGRHTRLRSHGQTATLRVTFLRKGSYRYTCTVPGHAAAGMKGVFTIT
jgi:plastocyanin